MAPIVAKRKNSTGDEVKIFEQEVLIEEEGGGKKESPVRGKSADT